MDENLTKECKKISIAFLTAPYSPFLVEKLINLFQHLKLDLET